MATLFGVDEALAGRLERTVKLASELEAATAALASGVDKACASLATDLEPTPIPNGAPACEVALRRLGSFRERLASAGARLVVVVKGVRCSAPKAVLEQCAGECVTGLRGVVSRVECGSGGAGDGPLACSGELSLPNAPAACLARCKTRALQSLACSADVDVRLEGASEDPRMAAVVERLRLSVPPLVGFATDAAARIADIARAVPPLVDDLGTAIDAMTSAPKSDRRLAVGAALAVCFAPPLARAVKASARLGTTLDGAKQLQAKLASP